MTKQRLCPFLAILFILPLCLFCLGACLNNDRPPDDGAPDPAPLNGVFACELGSFTFNGDGRTVRFDATDELAEATGLPAGEGEGEYVFLYQNKKWRYDKSETFRIIIGGKDCNMMNAYGTTNEDVVAIVMPDASIALFEKSE